MIRGYRLFVATALVALIVVLPALACAGGHGAARTEKLGILLVAFGSSVPEAQVSFEKIDQMVRSAHPNIPVRWAFTSHIIRNIHEEQGNHLDSPLQALASMSDEGFTHVVVQSLHSIPGEEYCTLVESVRRFEGIPGGIEHMAIGAPLLSTSDDIAAAADGLLKNYPEKRKKNEAVVLMGHGTHHPANVYYSALQHVFGLKDADTYVGTVEGWPELDDVTAQLQDRGYKKVWLMPFMSVAGDHARNDMAGDEPDSWKSILKSKGFEVQVVLHGTAEYDEIAAIWLAHLESAMASLK